MRRRARAAYVSMSYALLVTVEGPERTLDLELPGNLAVSDLLPLLVELCAVKPVAGEGPPGVAGAEQAWSLTIQQTGIPVPLTQTLLEAGVIDGMILILHPPEAAPVVAAQTDTSEQPFVPRSIAPSEHTGGIGVTWEQMSLS
jgi:hypothetical protein